MTETFAWFVGIDWGSETHALCVVDRAGAVCEERVVAHTGVALHETLQAVCRQTGARPPQIAVAVELTHGALVDTLLDHGFCVFAINPKQLDRFRDRFTAAGAKDDRRDARVAADALRTDPRAFRPLRPDAAGLVLLRELSRLLEDLQVQEARLANQLREQLYRVDAAWLTVSPAANESWLWAILAATPHPERWRNVPRRHIAATLRRHRIRRLTAETIITALHQPRLTSAAGVADAVALRIAALIPQLRLVHEQFRATEHQIDRLLAQLAQPERPGQPTEHRDAQILQSLPGVGRVVAATMLTEASGPLADRDYPTLRAYSGVAPITKRSGKRAFRVQMRYACKGRLRDALYHWSRTSLQHDAATRQYYARLRERGHSHGRALRSVGDRWLRILVAMLTARTLYDPSRFTPEEHVPA